MTQRYYSNGLLEIVTYVSTLGVGSSYTSGTLNLLPFKTLVGICSATSSNLVVSFQQGTATDVWQVSSTTAVAATNAPLDWTVYGRYGRIAISTVNSSVGELLRLTVYGIPG